MKGDDALWLGLTAWYLTVLALCATAGPGDGLIGEALQLLPPPVHTWLYAPAAGLLAWLLLRSLEVRDWSHPAAVVLSTVLALAFAALLELAQAWQRGQAPIVAHLGWASLGILLTWILHWLRPRTMVRSDAPADVISFRRAATRIRKGSFR